MRCFFNTSRYPFAFIRPSTKHTELLPPQPNDAQITTLPPPRERVEEISSSLRMPVIYFIHFIGVLDLTDNGHSFLVVYFAERQRTAIILVVVYITLECCSYIFPPYILL
ncbi:unnamed protein product [Rotaria magnacalcarata]